MMMDKKRHRPPLTGAMNIVSLTLLCATLGRLFFVLHLSGNSKSSTTQGANRVPHWLPVPQQSVKSYRTGQQEPASYHSTSYKKTINHSGSLAYSAGRRGDDMPAQLQMQFSHNLRRASGDDGDYHRKEGRARWVVQQVESEAASRDSGATNSARMNSGVDDTGWTYAWGQGMRVLLFTMDSMQDTVTKSKVGGAAGEIIVRESLTDALTEAGVQVELAVSDVDFERRAGIMDFYSALIVDPWTWAGKGWRLKPQLVGRQNKLFILDFFGSDKPHANLGVPLPRHLTAFPVPASQQRTFLGYRVEPSQRKASSGTRRKRQQGVIWAKSASSFRSLSTRNLLARLANLVELHSTVAPENAIIRHENIVYHGHLPREEWYHLLEQSKFVIGLGDPLSGPSAIDAVVAGCTYLNPVYSRPVKNIYSSQHPFLAESVGEPYVCSFGQTDINAAIECALVALEQDLPPFVPQELSKEAHASRVRTIFEPLTVIPQELQ